MLFVRSCCRNYYIQPCTDAHTATQKCSDAYNRDNVYSNKMGLYMGYSNFKVDICVIFRQK